jgi:hypothetical protein
MKFSHCLCVLVALVICVAAPRSFSQTTLNTNNVEGEQNITTNAAIEASHEEQIYGKWFFDRDFSFLQLTNSNPDKWPKAPPGVPDWVAPNPLLIFGQLDGVTYMISSNEITAYAKGTVHSNSYKILARPSPHEIVMKMGDGSTNTLRFLQGRMEFDVNLGFKLYFSREAK